MGRQRVVDCRSVSEEFLLFTVTENYAKVAISEIEDVLQHVWVAGPGAASPGTLLSEGLATMTREHAAALAIDLSRRSTPADGGLCTFQAVVQGGACPWNLDCHNCDKFVLSGADLNYWHRKREQWAAVAERDPTTPPPTTCTRYSNPAPAQSPALRKPSPPSDCSTKHSP
jgi:hypothetical protein